MKPPIETIHFDNGLTGTIAYDEPDRQPPYADSDTIRIVILSRRYEDPARGECGTTPQALADWTVANAATWWTIPLYAYQHGNIVYQPAHANPFHCPFDSARAGSIALRRDSFPADERQLRLEAETIAQTFSDWANGECYSFTLLDAQGQLLESGGGIIGYEAALSALTDVASSFTPAHAMPPPSAHPEPEQGTLFE